jgi:hypothetical protein
MSKEILLENVVKRLKKVKKNVAYLMDEYEGKDAYLFYELWEIYNRLAKIIKDLEET